MTGPLSNPKHEKFAQNVASGMGIMDSYKAAGFQGSDPRLATVIHNKSHIKDRIVELREDIRITEIRAIEKTADRIAKTRQKELEAGAAGIALTREYVVGRLIENVERAMQATPVLDAKGIPTGEWKYEGSVANKALELLGKHMGMFVERREVGAPGEFAAVDDPEKMRELILRRLSLGGPKIIEGEVIDDAD